jgi:phage baseplate assembly protein W
VDEIKSLALVNGDLAIGTNGGYMLYNGVKRIQQDLTLALTEEYGTDRFHPTYGSIVQSYLGQVLTPDLMMLVRAEVNRVLQNYLLIQQNEVLRDTLVDVTNRYDTSDVVRSVDSVQTRAVLDTIYLAATLTTLSRETVTVTRQVAAA